MPTVCSKLEKAMGVHDEKSELTFCAGEFINCQKTYEMVEGQNEIEKEIENLKCLWSLPIEENFENNKENCFICSVPESGQIQDEFLGKSVNLETVQVLNHSLGKAFDSLIRKQQIQSRFKKWGGALFAQKYKWVEMSIESDHSKTFKSWQFKMSTKTKRIVNEDNETLKVYN